jgi:hypothetical protein
MANKSTQEHPMKKTVICGAEVHDNSITARIAVNRKEPETRIFSSATQGRNRMFRYLKRLARRHGAERIVMAYEASVSGYGLCDESANAGIECCVLAPARPIRRKRKSHKRDAAAILERLRAYLLAGNDPANIWIPDFQTRDDHEVALMRLEAADKLAEARAQVCSLLKRNNVEKPRQAGNVWTDSDCLRLQELTEPGNGLAFGARVALTSLLNRISVLETELKELDEAMKTLVLRGDGSLPHGGRSIGRATGGLGNPAGNDIPRNLYCRN